MISFERQRALKQALRRAEYERRMRAIAALPVTPDPQAVEQWLLAVKRDDHTDRHERPARGAP